jgi:molybdopterin-containing oxidoreductase family molybdopterin binding subunit
MADVKIVRTVCDPNCHASPRCGINTQVENGRIVKIEPGSFPLKDYDRRICAMGMARLEQQYHRDRLRHPIKRTGARGAGQWQRISWDEAFDLLAQRLGEIADKYGSRSLAFVAGSGAAGVLTKGSLQRFAAALGASANRAGGVDYGVPKGLEYMFGVPAATYFRPGGHEFADALNSRLIVLWGGNPADTRLVDFHFILEAQRRDTKIICIDPNRTTTAQKADRWISPRPGTDTALALSLLHEIICHDKCDWSFLRKNTNAAFLVRRDTGAFLRDTNNSYLVWDASAERAALAHECAEPALNGDYRQLLDSGEVVGCAPAWQLLCDLAASYPAQRAEAITGVAAAEIRELAHEIGSHKPAAIRIGYGVDRWYYSDYTARAVANLVVATGNIGIAGGGISVHDGTYAAPLNLNSFRAPEGREAATLNMMELMQAIEPGEPYPVRALWLSASNMFNQTAANRSRVLREIIPKLDLIVVVDQFMTDSAALADIVLPAASIFEKDDLVAGMFLQLQRRAVEPEGECKADFDIFAGLAARMGIGECFARPLEDYLRPMIETDHPLLEGITYERLQREGALLLNRPAEPYVAFRDGKFNTSSGRIEIYKEELLPHGAALPCYHEPIEASDANPAHESFPLTLLFSHSRHRVHSSFANLDKMKQREPQPAVELHPSEAQLRQLTDGQLVRVHNQRGSVELACRINADVKPGVAVIAEGTWVKDFPAGDPYSLTHEQVSATSENYAFFDTLVQVTGA